MEKYITYHYTFLMETKNTWVTLLVLVFTFAFSNWEKSRVSFEYSRWKWKEKWRISSTLFCNLQEKAAQLNLSIQLKSLNESHYQYAVISSALGSKTLSCRLVNKINCEQASLINSLIFKWKWVRILKCTAYKTSYLAPSWVKIPVLRTKWNA